MRNPKAYETSLEALKTAGCPQELAEKVSQIVANDNPNQTNLGRTPEEIKAVHEAVKYLQ